MKQTVVFNNDQRMEKILKNYHISPTLIRWLEEKNNRILIILFELEKSEKEINDIFISVILKKGFICLKNFGKKKQNKHLKQILSTVLIIGIGEVNPTIGIGLFVLKRFNIQTSKTLTAGFLWTDSLEGGIRLNKKNILFSLGISSLIVASIVTFIYRLTTRIGVLNQLSFPGFKEFLINIRTFEILYPTLDKTNQFLSKFANYPAYGGLNLEEKIGFLALGKELYKVSSEFGILEQLWLQEVGVGTTYNLRVKILQNLLLDICKKEKILEHFC